MTSPVYHNYPMGHPSLGSLQSALTSIWNTAKSEGTKAVQRTTRAASEGSFDLLDQQASNIAKSIIDSAISAIPPEARMTELGNEIADKIIDVIDRNVLPSMFNASAQAASVGAFLSDDKIEEIRLKIINNIPERQSTIGMTFPLRQIIASALTRQKFNTIFQKIQPLVDATVDKVKPAVELKKNQVIGFVAINSFLAGCAVMAATIWLYQSIDND